MSDKRPTISNGKVPTRKVTASTLAAFAAPFIVDVVEMFWLTVPPTFEPFLYALLVFGVGFLVSDTDRGAA